MKKMLQGSLLPEGYLYSPAGYLWHVLPVDRFMGLPETVTVGDIILKRKTEFHVTVINGRGVASDIAGEGVKRVPEIEEDLQKILSEYLKESPIKFLNFEDDLRLAVTSERTSIAARCKMENLEGYFALINTKYGKECPVQPAHVSIYTATGLAVGIDSVEEMESYKKIELPEVQEVLDSVLLETKEKNKNV